MTPQAGHSNSCSMRDSRISSGEGVSSTERRALLMERATLGPIWRTFESSSMEAPRRRRREL